MESHVAKSQFLMNERLGEVMFAELPQLFVDVVPKEYDWLRLLIRDQTFTRWVIVPQGADSGGILIWGTPADDAERQIQTMAKCVHDSATQGPVERCRGGSARVPIGLNIYFPWSSVRYIHFGEIGNIAHADEVEVVSDVRPYLRAHFHHTCSEHAGAIPAPSPRRVDPKLASECAYCDN